MPSYILSLQAPEAVRLLRTETEAALGQPELDICAWREYVIEEDFDRSAYGIQDGEDLELVTALAILTIEPRVERNYWVLQIMVERALGPLTARDEQSLSRTELTVERFEAELRAAGSKRITVRLEAETPAAKQHFDHWLADIRARHPSAVRPGQPRVSAARSASSPDLASHPEEAAIAESPARTATWIYGSKEVVAVFDDADALETAVNELETSGFDRAATSVLATSAKAERRIESLYRTAREIEDSGDAPRGAFVSRHSRTEGEAAAVGVPLYIGGVAGAFATVASGGTLALAIAAAIAGGAAGAGLGSLLAMAIGRRHSARIGEALRRGGLILWVSVATPEAEKRALALLERLGGQDVHVHEIHREWSIRDIPLGSSQLDLFFERDPQPRG
jgi:hypothetical protein